MSPRSTSRSHASKPRIAVLIPCYNEELTVAQVVTDFKAELPHAAVYVFDNNSTDRTAVRAREAGAAVVFEARRGKGFVVQSMFRTVDADIYVMVDGDQTYPAKAVQRLIEPIADGEADMVIGSRLQHASRSDFRWLNWLGNRFYLALLGAVFGVTVTDLLSGYRAFNRRLVRNLPLFGGGFETEAELTIKALQRGFRIVEVPVHLSPRPVGSRSKIRIVRDGFVILSTILTLLRDYKPLTFFGGLGLGIGGLACIPAVRVIAEYVRHGSLTHIGAAIAALALAGTGVLCVSVGLVLHTIARHFQELDFQLQMRADEAQNREDR